MAFFNRSDRHSGTTNSEKKRFTLDRTVILTVVGIWLAAGAFYWFSYHPMVIRQKCNKVGVSALKQYNNSAKAYTFFYDQCMHKYGIK